MIKISNKAKILIVAAGIMILAVMLALPFTTVQAQAMPPIINNPAMTAAQSANATTQATNAAVQASNIAVQSATQSAASHGSQTSAEWDINPWGVIGVIGAVLAIAAVAFCRQHNKRKDYI